MGLSRKIKESDEVKESKLEYEILGQMRDATTAERESVNEYVKSISKKTGKNFFDFYDN